MVPHVAARGFSFKGAGLYYLHDKSAKTSERVDWTLTRNVPTNDPNKALKWMTYTAMNADRIKAEYGGSRVGRKSEGKYVYTYSLSWHKDDKPTREEMQNAVFETLDRMKLTDHEAVIVAHRDTDHPHVHVICNLVNPNTGRTHTAQLDHKKLSEWAQEHDQRFERDHCSERIKNNQERSTSDLKAKFVKHRAKEDSRAVMIQNIYSQSDSGKSFKAALREQGYILAQGHKGRVALVNEEGQVFSLARQLKKQRARDIKARLKDIDFKSLPLIKELAEQQRDKIITAGIKANNKKQTIKAGFKSAAKEPEAEIFDRDQYEADWQKSIVDAAIESEKNSKRGEKEKTHDQGAVIKPEVQKGFKEVAKKPVYDDGRLTRLDREMAFSKYELRKRQEFEERMKELYGRDKMAKQLKRLDDQIKKKSGLWNTLTGNKKELEERYGILKKELVHVDEVISGYRKTLEREIKEMKQQHFGTEEQKLTRGREERLEIQNKYKNRAAQNKLEGGLDLG